MAGYLVRLFGEPVAYATVKTFQEWQVYYQNWHKRFTEYSDAERCAEFLSEIVKWKAWTADWISALSKVPPPPKPPETVFTYFGVTAHENPSPPGLNITWGKGSFPCYNVGGGHWCPDRKPYRIIDCRVARSGVGRHLGAPEVLDVCEWGERLHPDEVADSTAPCACPPTKPEHPRRIALEGPRTLQPWETTFCQKRYVGRTCLVLLLTPEVADSLWRHYAGVVTTIMRLEQRDICAELLKLMLTQMRWITDNWEAITRRDGSVTTGEFPIISIAGGGGYTDRVVAPRPLCYAVRGSPHLKHLAAF